VSGSVRFAWCTYDALQNTITLHAVALYTPPPALHRLRVRLHAHSRGILTRRLRLLLCSRSKRDEERDNEAPDDSPVAMNTGVAGAASPRRMLALCLFISSTSSSSALRVHATCGRYHHE
jgi:hypothetical protein